MVIIFSPDNGFFAGYKQGDVMDGVPVFTKEPGLALDLWENHPPSHRSTALCKNTFKIVLSYAPDAIMLAGQAGEVFDLAAVFQVMES